jgi:hypothetical protein
MNDMLWSINIMLGTLLSGVGYLIYWIMTYDDRDSGSSSSGES